MTQTKYELDIQVQWKDLKEILDNNRKAPGFFNRFKYYINYSQYAPLVNFAIEVINTYQVPYDELKKL